MDDPLSVTTSKSLNGRVGSSISSKYADLIGIPFSTQLKMALISIFGYLENYAPRMPVVHVIITFFRFFQIFGPSILVNYASIFDINSNAGLTFSYFSVLYHVVPVQYRVEANEPVLWCCSCLQFLYLLLLTIAAFIYKRTTRLNNCLMHVLNIMTATIIFLVPGLSVEYIGEAISMMITQKSILSLSHLHAVIFAIIITGLMYYLTIYIYTKTLTFRPCSFMTIESKTQNILYTTTLTITFVSALGSFVHKEAAYVILVILIICYVIIMMTCFMFAFYISEIHRTFVLTASLCGILNCIYNFIPLATNKRFTDTDIIISVILYIVIYFISYFIIRKSTQAELVVLDNFEEEPASLPAKRFLDVKRLLSTGFHYAHPCCIKLSIIQYSTEQWPQDPTTWALYAKFAAIYPENSALLVSISQHVVNRKLKGVIADTTLSGIHKILKTREQNLSAELKSTIVKIQKQLQKTKTKLRTVWDLILQGNIAEMESCLRSAFDAVYSSEIEINHLYQVYPSNRFVARLYARYAKQILSDHMKYKEWSDNYKKLQRGILIKPDVIHQLGLAAFPSLPTYMLMDNIPSLYQAPEDNVLSDDFMQEEDPEGDSSDLLEQIINKYRFKSVIFLLVGTIVFYLIFVFPPAVAIMASFNRYSNNLKEPLNIMYGCAYNRNLVNLFTSLTGYYLMTCVPDPKDPTGQLKMMDPVMLSEDFDMSAFGGNRDAVSCLEYCLQETSTSAQLLSDIHSYELGNIYIDQARSLLFDQTIQFKVFQEDGEILYETISVESVPLRIASQISKVIQKETLTAEDVTSTATKIAMNNDNMFNHEMNNILSCFITYLEESNAANTVAFTAIIYSLMAVIDIPLILLCFFQIRLILHSRIELFKVLFTLPKTVIGSISSTLSTLKQTTVNTSDTSGTESSEVNKQEDTILKQFAAISDNKADSSTNAIIIIAYILLSISSCLNVYLTLQTFLNMSNTLIENAPHIDYVFGTYSYINTGFAKFWKLILNDYDPVFEGISMNKLSDFSQLYSSLIQQVSYYHMFRYGGRDSDEFPFVTVSEAIRVADTIVVCEDNTKPPESLIEHASCSTAEGQFFLLTAQMKKLVWQAADEEDPVPINPQNPLLPQLFQIGPIQLYVSFYYPVCSNIVNTIVNSINTQAVYVYSEGMVMIIFGLLMVLVIAFAASIEEKYMRFTLRLLLQGPPRSIFQSNKIMAYLSGISSSDVDETMNRDDNYFKNVIQKINEGVLITHKDSDTVISVNSTFEKMFNLQSDDIVGKELSKFFTSERFEGNLEDAYKSSASLCLKGDNEKSSKHIFFSTILYENERIINCRDETEIVTTRQEIDEQHIKAKDLLASILPHQLVQRVQGGESNISFQIRIASILSCEMNISDLVNGESTDKVMSKLSFVYDRINFLTMKYKSVTKLKLYSNLFMAAGGLFDNTDQPTVYTKDLLSFSIELLQAFPQDKEEKQIIKPRMAVHVGGPIIAGVLSTEKPTFEILGKAVSVNYNLLLNTPQMSILISRPVYELIYSEGFNIKDNVEIVTKSEKLQTYLVLP